jgi:hypothetical protein
MDRNDLQNHYNNTFNLTVIITNCELQIANYTKLKIGGDTVVK